MKNGIIFFFSFFSFFTFSQKTIILSQELKEISGIQYINDTLIAAHNDGGNGPMLYFLNPNSGKILKRVVVKGVKNTDWEDISIDPNGTIYIADVGNNLNNRTNLSIVKIDGKLAINQAACRAEIIQFSYRNQLDFPPNPQIIDINFWQFCIFE